MALAHPQSQEPLYMTQSDYLEFEEKSELKHEFVNGRVYAMAGAGLNHNIINGNLQTTLNNQLSDKPCIVVSSDMRLKVESDSVSFRYPDTMVMCGDIELADNRSDTVTNPSVIIEVLSPSTALKDYNEKLEEYTKIESVQYYVIVAQHTAKVEVFSRHESDKWLYEIISGLDSSVDLSAIGCTLSLTNLYAKTSDLRSDNDEN